MASLPYSPRSHRVQIAAGKTNVQLPDGSRGRNAGDVAALTEEEFLQIPSSLFPATVIDLEPTSASEDVVAGDVPAATIAATPTTLVGKVKKSGTVTAATVTARVVVVAHATDNRTLSLHNVGAANAAPGAGNLVASLVLDTPTTDNLLANIPKALVLSATAANLEVAAGDQLVVVESVGGSGLVHSGYKVEVTVGE